MRQLSGNVERPAIVADFLGAFLEAPSPQHRLKRIGLRPPRLVDRLPVVVNVEQDGSRRSGHQAFSVHQRRRGRVPHFRFHAAAFEHLPELLGVALDIGQVGAHVGNRHQVHELPDDGCLVLTYVALNVDLLRECRLDAKKYQKSG